VGVGEGERLEKGKLQKLHEVSTSNSKNAVLKSISRLTIQTPTGNHCTCTCTCTCTKETAKESRDIATKNLNYKQHPGGKYSVHIPGAWNSAAVPY
jgi:hypothetical protein